jgi:hypothetical protein
MRSLWRGVTGCAFALALAGCARSGPEPGALGVDDTALSQADMAIAAQLYAGTPRTPPGFAVDAVPQSPDQVLTYHLKTQSAPTAGFELCTDDWSEAFAWSEDAAMREPEYLDYVANDAVDSYFEFDRVARDQPGKHIRMRVYRCQYLDRTGVNLAASSGYAGKLNRRPLDAAALRELAEYLWRFTRYNDVGHAVIASEAAAGSTLSHAITIASLVPGPADCDSVSITEWVHTVSPTNGTLGLETKPVRAFRARREDGAISGC